jgi:hypothetical protein
LEIEKNIELNFENKKIEFEQLNVINMESNLQTQITNLLDKLYNKEKTINELTAQNFNLSNENIKLKEKINKIKNTFSELTNKFQKELENKSKKDIYVNQTNSKLFNEIVTKNKDLYNKLNNLNGLYNKLKLEKFELENICLKQEEKINKYETKSISHSNSCYFLNEYNYLDKQQDYNYNNNLNYKLLYSKNYSQKLFPIRENKKKLITKKKNHYKAVNSHHSISSINDDNNLFLPSIK